MNNRKPDYDTDRQDSYGNGSTGDTKGNSYTPTELNKQHSPYSILGDSYQEQQLKRK